MAALLVHVAISALACLMASQCAACEAIKSAALALVPTSVAAHCPITAAMVWSASGSAVYCHGSRAMGSTVVVSVLVWVVGMGGV